MDSLADDLRLPQSARALPSSGPAVLEPALWFLGGCGSSEHDALPPAPRERLPTGASAGPGAAAVHLRPAPKAWRSLDEARFGGCSRLQCSGEPQRSVR